MKRFVVGALTATLLAGPTAAQLAPLATTAKVFTAVDGVSMQGGEVVITGIVQGEQAPSTWRVHSSLSADSMEWSSACQRSALVAMAKPGQYLLEIQYSTSYGSVCKLSRVTP